MDGPHDLGGKDGFGPVDVTAPPFRNEWEKRQWALSKNVPIPPGTIDWWRHGIETMDPVTYATEPYFAKWCLNEIAHRIDRGLFTLEEVLTGTPDGKEASPAPPLDMDGALARLRTNNTDFRIEMETSPTFRTGDTVRTLNHPVAGHTRLPAYARGHTGTVIAHHGGHLYADAGAAGEHRGEHLYTVEFTAAELWGMDDPDTICLDLWEPYLESA
ncbi:MAG: nitrile hydratase subunit beta [Paracoccaceae bacterium]